MSSIKFYFWRVKKLSNSIRKGTKQVRDTEASAGWMFCMKIKRDNNPGLWGHASDTSNFLIAFKLTRFRMLA